MGQRIGLPIGTNASPDIANLTLYRDGVACVDDLLRSDPCRAQLPAPTHRFIVNLLTLDTLPPSSALSGLEWKEAALADGTCSFLGT